MRGVQTNGAKAGFVWRFVGEVTPAQRLAESGCVRQKRVVPASVADAKLSVAEAIQPGRFSLQAGRDGDKKELVAEESTP